MGEGVESGLLGGNAMGGGGGGRASAEKGWMEGSGGREDSWGRGVWAGKRAVGW